VQFLFSTVGSQNFPRMLSYISPQAYHDVTLDGNKGNFLAVVGRGESDKALMEPLKKFYKNGKFWYICMCIPRSLEKTYTRTNAQVVTSLQTSCYKSVHKLSTSCVSTACSQLLEQVWNKLLTTCNKLDGIIKLVTKLF
jgi:hypothetical protein